MTDSDPVNQSADIASPEQQPTGAQAWPPFCADSFLLPQRPAAPSPRIHRIWELGMTFAMLPVVEFDWQTAMLPAIRFGRVFHPTTFRSFSEDLVAEPDQLAFAMALCGPGDQYSKARGKEIAVGRLRVWEAGRMPNWCGIIKRAEFVEWAKLSKKPKTDRLHEKALRNLQSRCTFQSFGKIR